MNPKSANTTLGAGVVGSAAGVLVVMFLPHFWTTFVFTPNEAALATAAFGTIFGWGIRFLPKPKS